MRETFHDLLKSQGLMSNCNLSWAWGTDVTKPPLLRQPASHSTEQEKHTSHCYTSGNPSLAWLFQSTSVHAVWWQRDFLCQKSI